MFPGPRAVPRDQDDKSEGTPLGHYLPPVISGNNLCVSTRMCDFAINLRKFSLRGEKADKFIKDI